MRCGHAKNAGLNLSFAVGIVQHTMEQVISVELGVVPAGVTLVLAKVKAFALNGVAALDGGGGGGAVGAAPQLDLLPVALAALVDAHLVSLAVNQNQILGVASVAVGLFGHGFVAAGGAAGDLELSGFDAGEVAFAGNHDARLTNFDVVLVGNLVIAVLLQGNQLAVDLGLHGHLGLLGLAAVGIGRLRKRHLELQGLERLDGIGHGFGSGIGGALGFHHHFVRAYLFSLGDACRVVGARFQGFPANDDLLNAGHLRFARVGERILGERHRRLGKADLGDRRGGWSGSRSWVNRRSGLAAGAGTTRARGGTGRGAGARSKGHPGIGARIGACSRCVSLCPSGGRNHRKQQHERAQKSHESPCEMLVHPLFRYSIRRDARLRSRALPKRHLNPLLILSLSNLSTV